MFADKIASPIIQAEFLKLREHLHHSFLKKIDNEINDLIDRRDRLSSINLSPVVVFIYTRNQICRNIISFLNGDFDWVEFKTKQYVSGVADKNLLLECLSESKNREGLMILSFNHENEDIPVFVIKQL